MPAHNPNPPATRPSTRLAHATFQRTVCALAKHPSVQKVVRVTAIAILYVLVFVFAGGPSLGCALLSNTTPKSNFYAMRAGLETDGQSQKLKPANVLEVPNSWYSENLILSIHEEYAPPGSQGEEVIQVRDITLYRITDPTVAGQVAIAKAQQTRVFAADMAKGVVSLASLYAGMQSGGLAAIVPVVQNAIAAMSSVEERKSAATTIQHIVDSPDLSVAEKEAKIKAVLLSHEHE